MGNLKLSKNNAIKNYVIKLLVWAIQQYKKGKTKESGPGESNNIFYQPLVNALLWLLNDSNQQTLITEVPVETGMKWGHTNQLMSRWNTFCIVNYLWSPIWGHCRNIAKRRVPFRHLTICYKRTVRIKF